MLTIYRSETSASLRRVPIWLVGSKGTDPDTDETGGQPQICWHARGTTTANTSGTLSLVSANAGLYHVELTASEVSALGVGSVMYRSATAIANVSFFQVVNYDSGDSMRLGQFSLPNAAAAAAGGLLTFGTSTGQIQPSAGSVGLIAQTHSGATITGINNILAGSYSDVSFSVRAGGIQTTSIGAGDYSGVSVEVKTKGIGTNSITSATYSGFTAGGVADITPRSYSGVSVEVKTGGIQVVSIGAGSYSGVSVEIKTKGIATNSIETANTYSHLTIQGLSNYANISNVTVQPGTHSATTFRLDIGQSFSGVTIDGVRFVATAGERSIASSLLSTTLGGTTPRLIQQAFEVLRNRVQISGSTMTVYKADDATSSWTATVSTGTATIYQIDPGLA